MYKCQDNIECKKDEGCFRGKNEILSICLKYTY